MNTKLKLYKKMGIVVLTLFVSFLLYRIYVDNNVFEVTEYSLNMNDDNKIDLLKGKKIIQISDLHNKEFGNDNKTLIETINQINPDYILLTGDMVNAEDTSFEGFFSLVDNISAKYKCFYVVGNHELGLEYGLLDDIYDYLKNHNVYVLDNSFVNVDGINFYGLNYAEKYYIKKNYNVEQMNKDLRSMWW